MLKRSPAIVVRIVLLGMTLLAAPLAHALNFIVDTVDDRLDDDVADNVCHTSVNTCSLRAAIMQANHTSASVATIGIFVPAGTYLLTRPPIASADEETGDLNLVKPANLNQSIGIFGAGAGSTIVDANQLDRVFHIELGRTAYISDITLRNGYTHAPNDFGGGIYTEGRLTLTRCAIEGNRANSGGGIYSSDYSVLEIVDSTVRSNLSPYGGGIGLNGLTAIRGSTIYSNTSGFGGGILISSGDNLHPSRLYVVNSTLSNNSATINGGGIFAFSLGGNISSTFLYNASIVSNDADHDHDENGGTGGGVYVVSGARFVAVNSLIAGNTQQVGNAIDDCFGTLEVYGFNLLGDLTNCSFGGNGATGRGLVSLNTIGALQDNGGPTLTHALLAGSQGINATNNQGCIDETGASLTTDQRGAPRGAGLDCDVGAFEYGAVVPVDDVIFRNGFE